MSNIAFVGEPPDRAIVEVEYSGIDDALVTLWLECGHYWAGLTREMPQGDTLPCGMCTIVDLDAPEATQLSLFADGDR